MRLECARDDWQLHNVAAAGSSLLTSDPQVPLLAPLFAPGYLHQPLVEPTLLVLAEAHNQAPVVVNFSAGSGVNSPRVVDESLIHRNIDCHRLPQNRSEQLIVVLGHNLIGSLHEEETLGVTVLALISLLNLGVVLSRHHVVFVQLIKRIVGISALAAHVSLITRAVHQLLRGELPECFALVKEVERLNRPDCREGVWGGTFAHVLNFADCTLWNPVERGRDVA